MLEEDQRRRLLALARRSIRHGLAHGRPLSVQVGDYDPPLQEKRATFVTLERDGQLRGCIGTLQPYQPLVEDVAEHAFAAAFQDPRFLPLGADELEGLDIHIAVLSPAEPLRFSSEAGLLAQLRPGIDGLILEAPGHKGTFLPSVWASLPQPAEFLRQLKRKAGLPADFWSDDLRVFRYTTESFAEKSPRG